jgi:hypothetical protein
MQERYTGNTLDDGVNDAMRGDAGWIESYKSGFNWRPPPLSPYQAFISLLSAFLHEF